MISLLYVSRAVIQAGGEDRELAQILDAARERNPRIGVTGALIHMSGYFAQVLEGNAPPVNQLMIDILRDPRHSEVKIIEVTPVTKRRFPDWSMGWVPTSPAPRDYIEMLARSGPEAQTSEAAAALIDYMVRYAEGPHANA